MSNVFFCARTASVACSSFGHTEHLTRHATIPAPVPAAPSSFDVSRTVEASRVAASQSSVLRTEFRVSRHCTFAIFVITYQSSSMIATEVGLPGHGFGTIRVSTSFPSLVPSAKFRRAYSRSLTIWVLTPSSMRAATIFASKRHVGATRMLATVATAMFAAELRHSLCLGAVRAIRMLAPSSSQVLETPFVAFGVVCAPVGMLAFFAPAMPATEHDMSYFCAVGIRTYFSIAFSFYFGHGILAYLSCSFMP